MELITYLLRASILLFFLYGLYWLLLRKETFHQLNRLILIGIILSATFLPLQEIPPNWAEYFLLETASSYSQESIDRAEGIIPNLNPREILTEHRINHTSPIPSDFPIPYNQYIFLGYIVGVLIFGIKLIANINNLLRFLEKAETHRKLLHCTIKTSAQGNSFSFFRFIHLNKKTLEEPDYKYVMYHELVHVEQFHSIDILLAELFRILFWFHPFAWKLNDSIRLNLEYITDQSLLDFNMNRKDYQYALLRQTTNQPTNKIVNPFDHNIVKRIKMMNKLPSSNKKKAWYLSFPVFIFPLFLLLNPIAPFPIHDEVVWLIPAVAPSSISGDQIKELPNGIVINYPSKTHEGKVRDILLIIPSDYQRRDLLKVEEGFKNLGLKMHFDEVEYNDEGRFKLIGYNLQTSNGSTSSSTFTEAIPPNAVYISYIEFFGNDEMVSTTYLDHPNKCLPTRLKEKINFATDKQIFEQKTK